MVYGNFLKSEIFTDSQYSAYFFMQFHLLLPALISWSLTTFSSAHIIKSTVEHLFIYL